MDYSSERRIPVLDGLRGIAILLVMLVHFMPDAVMPNRLEEWAKKLFSTGGWVGVDLFFVLSGFLITGILLRSRKDPNYFRNFYIRRALRIFPLYFGALVFVFILLPRFVELPREMIQAEPLHWLYLSNVAYWWFSDVPQTSAPVMLEGFWSLSIEEHFYLAWPAIVLVANRRLLSIICLGLISFSILFRIGGLLVSSPDTHFFYLTPARLDAIAAGCFVAVLCEDAKVERLKRLTMPFAISAATSAALLLVSFIWLKGLWVSSTFMLTIGFTILAALFSSCLFLTWQRPNAPVSRLLSSAPLRFFGKYSYGLYVIHTLLLPTILRLIPDDIFPTSSLTGIFAVAVVRITVCIPLALFSWYAYESRFLKLKERYTAKTPSSRLSESTT